MVNEFRKEITVLTYVIRFYTISAVHTAQLNTLRTKSKAVDINL
jgi:hypothetical protein